MGLAGEGPPQPGAILGAGGGPLSPGVRLGQGRSVPSPHFHPLALPGQAESLVQKGCVCWVDWPALCNWRSVQGRFLPAFEVVHRCP